MGQDYLILLGTYADPRSETLPPPSAPLSAQNEEVADIATTLRNAGLEPTLIFAEQESIHRGTYEFLAPRLAYWAGIDQRMLLTEIPLPEHLDRAPFKKIISDNWGAAAAMLGFTTDKGLINADLSQYPRDYFSQYGNELHFIPGLSKEDVPGEFCLSDLPLNKSARNYFSYPLSGLISHLSNLRVPLRFVLNSPFGEGGRIVDLGSFIITSSALRGLVRPDLELGGLGKRNVCTVDSTQLSEDVHGKIGTNSKTHIDYFINGFVNRGAPVLLVDPELYEVNSSKLEKLKDEHAAEFIMVDDGERARVPANFLVLPDGRILMAAGTPKTQRRLEEVIGAEMVIATERPIDALLSRGYGLRCFTNVITW